MKYVIIFLDPGDPPRHWHHRGFTSVDVNGKILKMGISVKVNNIHTGRQMKEVYLVNIHRYVYKSKHRIFQLRRVQ